MRLLNLGHHNREGSDKARDIMQGWKEKVREILGISGDMLFVSINSLIGHLSHKRMG